MSNLKLWNELCQLTQGISEWPIEICEEKCRMLRIWHNSFRKRQKNGCGEKERPHALDMWIEWQSRTWQNGNEIWTGKWSLRIKFCFLRRMLRQDNNHQLNSMVNWRDQSMTKVGEEDEGSKKNQDAIARNQNLIERRTHHEKWDRRFDPLLFLGQSNGCSPPKCRQKVQNLEQHGQSEWMSPRKMSKAKESE